MALPAWLVFFQRTFPSANMVLVKTSRPVLVDTGFGSDFPETERLLRGAGIPPEKLSLVANTHYHCDHAGGNNGLQAQYGLRIAASRHEGAMINQRHPEACRAEWLDQPVEPYQVNILLDAGDTINAGEVTLEVLAAPGHTVGHIAFYEREGGILLCGDAFHGDDVAWLNTFGEGVDALERMQITLDRLAGLRLIAACSGHGALIEQPLAAIDAARRRYDKWLADPQKIAWHACKRIFSYALMLTDGLAEGEVAGYLLRCPWFRDYSRFYFETDPADFVQPLIQEMVRSGACGWHEGRLIPLTPYDAPPSDWPTLPHRPKDWPPVAEDW
ncbi:MAG: MBL fold metallo-hydrolase [Anaerolineae bacterium]|nr:MBL fold metallo-hydrolase [Anaerolineae bacterium]